MSAMLSLTRRGALIGAGALTLANAAGSVAFADAPGARKFVLVILRGALDGLAACAPVSDPHYRAARGTLALAPDQVLPLSDGMGLHPRLQYLHRQWSAGKLAVMHAAASPYRERSHFDGQDVLESGGAQVFGVNDGWLNRALQLLPADAANTGIGIGASVPLVLRGSAHATNWAPSFAPSADHDTLMRLTDLYASDALLGPALAQAMETAAIASDANMSAMGGTGRVGPGAYRTLTEAAARLMAAPGGPVAGVVSLDGWDTHAGQGAGDGALALRLGALDAALASLEAGLGAHWEKTVVIVASEFGRTVAENGTRGTDHGTGGVAFAFGGAVRGGRFVGDWPGLAPGALYQGRDLAPVNDVRGLFAGALRDHWGLERAAISARVFPGLAPGAAIEGLVV